MFNEPPTQTLPSGDSTSRTLLERVRLHDPEAWRRLVHLYGPVIYVWGQRAGLQSHDASDVTQEVLHAVSSHIARFRRERPSDSFRGWLRIITANKIRDHFRAQQKLIASHDALEDVPAPDPSSFDSSPSPADDIARRALELIQTEFEPTTWKAFLACVVSKLTAAQAAAELGLTVAAVHKAKSRVMNRLRRDLDGLVE